MGEATDGNQEALEPWKRRALDMYSAAMFQQLSRPENSVKAGWADATSQELLNEVWYHAAKLLKATTALDAAIARGESEATRVDLRKAVLEFAADVGNCAMIVAETTDALELVGEPDVGERGEEAAEWHYRRY